MLTCMLGTSGDLNGKLNCAWK